VIVLDSSAAADWLVGHRPQGEWVAQTLPDRLDLHAPHVLDVEVASAMRRLVWIGDVSVTEAERALEDLSDLRIVRHAHLPLLERMWHLRDNLTAPDAAFVALAEALDAPLVTTDGALARTPGHTAQIIGFPG
jgi:predicted nucleic acid-binding protein